MRGLKVLVVNLTRECKNNWKFIFCCICIALEFPEFNEVFEAMTTWLSMENLMKNCHTTVSKG